MKKIISIILAVLMLCALCVPAFADDTPTSGSCGDNLSWSINDDHTVLTFTGSGAMKDYGYYSDCVPWWDYRDSVTTLNFPAGITHIGTYSFCSFSKIKNLELPASCAEIAYEAFYNCAALEEVSLYGDVGEDAFVYCYALKRIMINEGCTSIGQEAFSECYALESLSLPRSIKTIECEAFEYDTNLKNVIYYGTKDELSNVNIDKDDNEPLVAAIDGGHVTCLTEGKYNYIDENGAPATVDGTKERCWSMTDTTELTGGWYIVEGTVDRGGTIHVTGDSNIILKNGCELKTWGGIAVGNKITLNIYSESLDETNMGKITVTGAPDYCPGIGSGMNTDSTVLIAGGRISAKGGAYGAGIGSGKGTYSDCSVTITNGIVEATGGNFGAGIGSGRDGWAVVRIKGGSVTATGGTDGAGIGSGRGSTDQGEKSPGGAHCPVYILNGNVTAYGGSNGAGIGSGYTSFGAVDISGGNITAYGGLLAAGIGSGHEASCTVKLSGGDIKATAGESLDGYGYADGIGSGFRGTCDLTDTRPVKTGSTLSQGNWWIIAAVGAAAVIAVAAIVITKKKKPAAANGTGEE